MSLSLSSLLVSELGLSREWSSLLLFIGAVPLRSLPLPGAEDTLEMTAFYFVCLSAPK